MRNTHIDLYCNHFSDALRGVLDGDEGNENELCGKIEHATLYDDIDGGASHPCRDFPAHATYVARLARREVPDAPSDEGRHYHVRAQWK